MGGPMGSRMPPSAGMMMPGSNPYGPSGPPPPSLSGTPFSAPSGGMNMPPGGGRMSSMYPSSAGGMSGSAAGGPGVGGATVGGASHPQHPHPPAPGSGMGPGGGGTPPTSKPSSILNTVQLQQLSAQLKAYRLLARNVSPPEALISIVHGRKPTAAMLANLSKQSQQQHQQQSSQHTSSSNSLNVPPTSTQGDAQKGNSASEGGSGGNISLYPLSPNVSQAGGSSAAPGSTVQVPPARSTSSLAQSLSSSMSAGGAPNVTISSSGELPLSVKQAMSAAQTRYSVKYFMEEKLVWGENVPESLSFLYKIPSNF